MSDAGWRKVDKTMLDRLSADDRLTRADLRTLLLALRHESEPCAEVCLSARFVAVGIRLSKRSSETALAHLQALGYLLPVGHHPKTRATMFRIACPAGTEADADTEGQPDTEAEPDVTPKQERTSSPKQTRTNRRPYRRPTIRPSEDALETTARNATDDADVDALLEAFAAVKPPRLDHSRSRARGHLQKLLQKHLLAELLEAIQNYGAACDAAETEPQYRRNAGNFFGRDADFAGFLPGVYQKPDMLDGYRLTPEQEKEWVAFEGELAAGDPA